jgi:hypothetical protein
VNHDRFGGLASCPPNRSFAALREGSRGGGRSLPRVTTAQIDDEVRLAQRIAGPTGFLLVLLLFLLLPAVGASCAVSKSELGAGSATASLSGTDLVTGGDPGLETSGAFDMPPALHAGTTGDLVPGGAARIFAIATVVVAGLGLLCAFVRVWRLRAWVTLAVATVAALLLTATELLIVGQWVAVAEDFAEWMTELPDTQGIDVVGRAGEIVRPQFGFWVSLAGLVAIAAPNLVLLARNRT